MQDSNISTDKLSLSNNINQNLTQFIGQDGSKSIGGGAYLRNQ